MVDINVFKLQMAGPDDVSELRKKVESGEIIPEEIIAVLGKTEGNGCVNDFTRGFCTASYRKAISDFTGQSENEVEEKVAFVMSGGTEGVMSPHAMIFTKKELADEKESEETALSVSVGFTRNFLPEEMGRVEMVQEVKNVVLQLMEDAGIRNAEDVHFVQIKCPLLTSDRILDAESRGEKVVVHDTYKSMGYTRGASALGVAIALGEIEENAVTDESILEDFSLYSAVASTSAGVELLNCEIILMGNSVTSNSRYKIGHSIMKDAIDLESVIEAMRSAGLDIETLPDEAQKKRIVNVLAKAEASPDGYVRGRRNTMLTDSDINHTRHARAVVNGVIASLIGDPMVYVSGGAEHQGPAGGGPVAVIIEK
ncbi:ring-opening amidohydrolase [Proteiniclasticum sp. SCR006]|uniref:Cyanuric acid amidohydrolase n=1 Tax=Proteiniclasticum aestuarii TaxID=2817862 RepID=A0A939H9N1_9CLOT|nr:ring-opening amidohydrolase [Proteiniclasticum aestuarii]MBO1264026.1 ring-opening amidohydrolase [Proteiniclasticum aestuarii]